MKKMILSVFALTVMGTAAYAQDNANVQVAPQVDPTVAAQAQQAQADQQPQEQKTPVDAAALPDGIKKVLATDAYKEWTMVSGWHVTGGTAEYYVLEMQKGEERATLKMNSNGQQI